MGTPGLHASSRCLRMNGCGSWKVARCRRLRTSTTSSGRHRSFPPMSIGLPVESSPPEGLDRGWGVAHADWKVAGIHASIARNPVARNVNGVEKGQSKMKQIFRSLFVILPVLVVLTGAPLSVSAKRLQPLRRNPSSTIFCRCRSTVLFPTMPGEQPKLGPATRRTAWRTRL